MGTVGAIVGAAGLLYSGYSGERSNSQGIKARNRTRLAQTNAENAAAAEAKAADQANKDANAVTPNLDEILAKQKADQLKGGGATLITGSGGVDPERLKLGRRSSLINGGGA